MSRGAVNGLAISLVYASVHQHYPNLFPLDCVPTSLQGLGEMVETTFQAVRMSEDNPEENELEIADLREFIILRHLTDSELTNIKCVHVYGSDRNAFEGPSALYVTQTDEVFLAGFDSLVGKSTEEVPDGRPQVLKGSVKVQELSGKSVQKIVVGAEFGATLTSGNELYMWGSDLGPSSTIPAGISRLVVEHHIDGPCCSKCSTVHTAYGSMWSYCERCGSFHNKVSTIPHASHWKGPTTTGLGYAATGTKPQIPSTLFCIKCGGYKQCTTRTVSNFCLVICNGCHSVIDEAAPCIPTQTTPIPHKVHTSLKIEDIAAGINYLLIRSSSQLIVWGVLNGNRYNHAVLNPGKVKFSKVACGSAHIAVITDKGHLYTCGVGSEGQLGYSWSARGGCMELNNVALKEPAADVACGKSSTLCLLQSGAYVVYGNFNKIFKSGSMSMDLYDEAVIVIPSAVHYSFGNILDSSLKYQVQHHDKRLPVLTGDLSDAYILLHGLKLEKTTSAVIELCVSVSSQTDCELRNDEDSPKSQCQDCECQTEPELQESSSLTRSDSSATSVIHQISSNALLHGQHLLSDLTLKLADGDFPVHHVVLYTSSAYFRQLFVDFNPPDVLDMSSYNATAYRGLLKYFYGVPLGPMTCQDLFDLYVLATSYKEDWIITDVFSKLKSSIDAENVLLLHDRAKAANASDMLAECLNFMDAPEFKQSLFDSMAQNRDMLAEYLRLFLSNKL